MSSWLYSYFFPSYSVNDYYSLAKFNVLALVKTSTLPSLFKPSFYPLLVWTPPDTHHFLFKPGTDNSSFSPAIQNAVSHWSEPNHLPLKWTLSQLHTCCRYIWQQVQKGSWGECWETLIKLQIRHSSPSLSWKETRGVLVPPFVVLWVKWVGPITQFAKAELKIKPGTQALVQFYSHTHTPWFHLNFCLRLIKKSETTTKIIVRKKKKLVSQLTDLIPGKKEKVSQRHGMTGLIPGQAHSQGCGV